jgi:hypothetical protein
VVFIDRRRRESLVLQILQKSLHVIRLDIPSPLSSESLPDLRKVVVEAAAGLFAVSFPPVVKEFVTAVPREGLPGRALTHL